MSLCTGCSLGFLMSIDAAPAVHTAKGERSQVLKATSDLKAQTSNAKTQKGELSRDNESQGKSTFERWYKEQEIVQGTTVKISGQTGISQIPFYINWLEQSNLKIISTSLRKQS